MTIASDSVLNAADAALSAYWRELSKESRRLPPPLDESVVGRAWPRSDHERWLRERVVCSFCREDYKRSEPLWVRIGIACSHAGQIICADCISDIGFTACEWYLHSKSFASYVVNVFGTDEPPEDWEYLTPGWRQIADALRCGPEVYVPVLRHRSRV